jgi:uncharacterized membrane protein YoaK (UPF0700 family)
MRRLLTDAVRTLVPPSADRHGPLPPLMLVLTMVTGLTDSVSYLGLGHVFVANMTGNIVFLGFALAGGAGLSAVASLASLTAFLTGALAGGRLGVRLAEHRGRLLSTSLAAQSVLMAAAVVTSAVADASTAAGTYTLIVLLGLGMGLQNAVARRLGVPDLTTTVLTLTLTGLASDSTLAGGTAPRPGRRLLSVLAMFLGALIGAELLRHTGIGTVLRVALVVLVLTAVLTTRLSTTTAAWTRP